MIDVDYEEFFEKLTGFSPFPYQKRIAVGQNVPRLIRIPTGIGKTASIVISWLWRKYSSDLNIRNSTPRRLVYCLPMRVLVEQTVAEISKWVENFSKAYTEKSDDVPEVYTIMGGEAENTWDKYPERNQILVGTQDMLLSRALNRGYALSRFRSPIDFGLLNNDSLWVMDEVQIMGAALKTSAQLDAFRDEFGTLAPHSTIWMSATSEPEWLTTVDRRPLAEDEVLELGEVDHSIPMIEERVNAKKTLSIISEGKEIPLQSTATTRIHSYVGSIGEFVLREHERDLTIIIMNTVERAKRLYSSLREEIPDRDELTREKEDIIRKIEDPDSWARRRKDGELYSKDRDKLEEYKSRLITIEEKLDGQFPELILLHSRFRAHDRERLNNRISEVREGGTPPGGTVLVATQVVEAGIDISAKVMITELAPWTSLVQRFGRLNRYGRYENSKAIVIDIDTEGYNAESIALPYSPEELDDARESLCGMDDVSVLEVSSKGVSIPKDSHDVLRRKDILELFDTTPDLTGNDIDISKFIRDEKNRDVYVFWRELDEELSDISPPMREELCSVPIESVKNYLSEPDKIAYKWDHLEGNWRKVNRDELVPGHYLLVDAEQGGYSAETGWSPDSEKKVEPVDISESAASMSGTGSEDNVWSREWETLSEHTEKVINALKQNMKGLQISDEYIETLKRAALFHDVGKAHPIWQKAIRRLGAPDSDEIWAKSGSEGRLEFNRKYFRHELCSALQVARNPRIMDDLDPEFHELAIFLVASHHGRIRLSIRSLPDEDIPWEAGNDGEYPVGTRFARGVWEGDTIPEVTLNSEVQIPQTEIGLSTMGMGVAKDGTIPWIERMLNVRDTYGPFAVGYLEGILRTADWRASSSEGEY